jgi:3-oxoacyl-[acyl-carrier protein] reductase
MGSLFQRRALVTGAGQGIGAAIARRLLEQGCAVVPHYFRSEDGAREIARLAKERGGRALVCQADLRRPEEARRLVDFTASELGGIDILINNTGDLVERRRLPELTPDSWQEVMSVNLESVLWVTQAARPHLAAARDGASIVNLASLAGRKGGHPGSLAYSTAKGALLTWTRALATELAPEGIRVNAVAPGLILGSRFHATHTTEESARATIAGIPLGRAGSVDDVARAVTYLASEYDGFITGAILDINGGAYAA